MALVRCWPVEVWPRREPRCGQLGEASGLAMEEGHLARGRGGGYYHSAGLGEAEEGTWAGRSGCKANAQAKEEGTCQVKDEKACWR
jgi:hypothetical protein